VSKVETERSASPTVAGARVAQVVSDVLLFALASAAAAALAYGIWTQLPEHLDVETDIVGFPIYGDFNGYRYFWLYWLIAGFVPVVTLAILLVLRRLVPRSETARPPRPRSPAVEPEELPALPNAIGAVGVARVLFVGAVLGLEAAYAVSAGSRWILSVGLPVTAGYALAVCLVAVALGRTRRLSRHIFWQRLSLANAAGVPLSLAGLYAVARSTEVTIESSGRVYEYSWLPLWVALGLTAVAIGWLIARTRRAADDEAFRSAERGLLLVVAGPVALYLFVALVPGGWTGIDMFHEGELLAGGELVEEGAFPWRDVIFIHGFLTDAGFQLIGFNLFEHSRWGYVAGSLLVVLPLYWISFYYLFAYLFHRNWLFLVGTQLALVLGIVFEGQLRFIFLPLILLLLGALLTKGSVLRAAAFMTVLVAQTVLTPEAAILAFAVLVTVIAFEAYYYKRSSPLTENFRRTLLCAGVGALLTVAWGVFLAAFGALDDFVSTGVTFASDHQLTGALPVNWVNDRYRFAAVAPVVLVVLAFWFFAAQIIRRGEIRVADWVMGAAAIFVGLYYQKFLARTDEHVFQPYAVTIPLLYYTLYRLIGLVADGLSRIAGRPSLRAGIGLGITAVAVVVLLVEAPRTVADVVQDAPKRFDATAAQEPSSPRVGFIGSEGNYDQLLQGVGAVLDTYVAPDEEIFDFTNSPALYHYLLERRPATRFYHVSMAIRKETQEELIEDLERSRPRLVVFSSGGTGLPSWDGISNQVRHYLVSRYLLDRYRPLVMQEGYVFMARNDSIPRPEQPNDAQELLFRTYPCDWGYAPEFFSLRPSAPSPVTLDLQELGPMLTVAGWAVDREQPGPAAQVVAAIDGKVVAEAQPTGHRPDIADVLDDPAYLGSGFALAVPPGRFPPSRAKEIRLYAVSRSGKATELGYGSGSAVGLERRGNPAELRTDGHRVPVVDGAAQGFADTSSVSSYVVGLDLPPGTRARRYDWIELETSAPQTNGFLLSDDLREPERGISFRTLARGDTTVRVLVGACSQWHGYTSRRLYLRLDQRQRIVGARLYR
jgi:hypothetical protein